MNQERLKEAFEGQARIVLPRKVYMSQRRKQLLGQADDFTYCSAQPTEAPQQDLGSVVPTATERFIQRYKRLDSA